jgi:PPOX class probable F420-dependent enzyme
MSSKRKDNPKSDSITDPSIAELFEGKNFAFLATLMKGGTPHVTPTWVDIDRSNNTILINTAKGRVKHKNISRDPRVGVSVVDFSNPYHMVSVRGKVIEQINGKEVHGQGQIRRTSTRRRAPITEDKTSACSTLERW